MGFPLLTSLLFRPMAGKGGGLLNKSTRVGVELAARALVCHKQGLWFMPRYRNKVIKQKLKRSTLYYNHKNKMEKIF